MKVKFDKFFIDAAVAAILFLPAYLNLSWLPQFVQDFLVEKSSEQIPADGVPELIYLVLMTYSAAAIARLRQVEIPLLNKLLNRKGNELVGTLAAAIGVLAVLTTFEHINGRENAILLGFVLMVAYTVFLYAPIWIGNTLIDAVDLSEMHEVDVQAQGISSFAIPTDVRVNIAYIFSGSVFVAAAFGMFLEWLN